MRLRKFLQLFLLWTVSFSLSLPVYPSDLPKSNVKGSERTFHLLHPNDYKEKILQIENPFELSRHILAEIKADLKKMEKKKVLAEVVMVHESVKHKNHLIQKTKEIIFKKIQDIKNNKKNDITLSQSEHTLTKRAQLSLFTPVVKNNKKKSEKKVLENKSEKKSFQLKKWYVKNHRAGVAITRGVLNTGAIYYGIYFGYGDMAAKLGNFAFYSGAVAGSFLGGAATGVLSYFNDWYLRFLSPKVNTPVYASYFRWWWTEVLFIAAVETPLILAEIVHPNSYFYMNLLKVSLLAVLFQGSLDTLNSYFFSKRKEKLSLQTLEHFSKEDVEKFYKKNPIFKNIEKTIKRKPEVEKALKVFESYNQKLGIIFAEVGKLMNERLQVEQLSVERGKERFWDKQSKENREYEKKADLKIISEKIRTVESRVIWDFTNIFEPLPKGEQSQKNLTKDEIEFDRKNQERIEKMKTLFSTWRESVKNKDIDKEQQVSQEMKKIMEVMVEDYKIEMERLKKEINTFKKTENKMTELFVRDAWRKIGKEKRKEYLSKLNVISRRSMNFALGVSVASTLFTFGSLNGAFSSLSFDLYFLSLNAADIFMSVTGLSLLLYYKMREKRKPAVLVPENPFVTKEKRSSSVKKVKKAKSCSGVF